MTQPRSLPRQLAIEVEQFITDEHDNAARYSNREVLDDSGVYDLHALAARIYHAGWTDGAGVQEEKQRCADQRKRARGEDQ